MHVFSEISDVPFNTCVFFIFYVVVVVVVVGFCLSGIPASFLVMLCVVKQCAHSRADHEQITMAT